MPLDQSQQKHQNLATNEQDISSGVSINMNCHQNQLTQEFIGPIVTALPPVILAPKVYFLEPNHQTYAYATMAAAAATGHIRYPPTLQHSHPTPPPQQYFQMSPPMYDFTVHGNNSNRMNPALFLRAVNNNNNNGGGGSQGMRPQAQQINTTAGGGCGQWPAVHLRQTFLHHHQSSTQSAQPAPPTPPPPAPPAPPQQQLQRMMTAPPPPPPPPPPSSQPPRQKLCKLAEELAFRDYSGEYSSDFFPMTSRQRLSYTKSFDVEFEEDSLIDSPLYKWEPETIMLHKNLMYWLHDAHYVDLF